MNYLIDNAMMMMKKTMPPCPLFFNYCILMLLLQLAAAVGKDGCPDKCGNITVPYPFGLTPACARENFELICDKTYSPPKLFIYDDIEITSISLHSAELTVRLNASRACYNASGKTGGRSSYMAAGPGRPFRFSARNRFTTLGCSAVAVFTDPKGRYVSSCVSTCTAFSVFDPSGACFGVGCCQSSFRQGFWFYEPMLSTLSQSISLVADISLKPCIYAFLVIDGEYRFNALDLNRTDDFKTPVALNWAIRDGNETCDEASRNKTTYACQSPVSNCSRAIDGEGYLCNCSKGYEGNPYLPDGCKDIDECKFPNQYPCFGDCTNTNGSYVCKCPKGKQGNAMAKDGCSSKDHFTLALKVVTGASIGVFFIIAISLFVYLGFQRRKLIKTKQKFFEQNGGFLLQQQIHSGQGTSFKIFSKEELEKATRNFDDGRILGRGGHGTVYKGVLDDGTVVAIKKSKLMDASETKEFAMEMSILSQLNHKNIVKILGCCLEVEVPMLAYEYVSNGTLYHLIHERQDISSPIPFDLRLKIAIEAAEALAYLHSAASPPILHGDVKSANVLLDGNFSAKVSDFGASRLAPVDEVQLATLVQGTCGYLDPEYLITSQLTDKSDVYSFGVVLLELLTGRKAFHFGGPEEDRSLASCFLKAMDENRLLDIIDGHIIADEESEAMIRDMAELASQCLRRTREERPTMREVAESLDILRRYKKHSWIRNNAEETQSLLDKH